jgi:replicative DNA helicase
MKLAQRELELKVLKIMVTHDNATFIAGEKALKDYHFLTKEPGVDQSITAQIFKLCDSYAKSSGGYKLTETVLESMLTKKGLSAQLQGKFLNLWYDIVDTEVEYDEFPYLIVWMKERYCKNLIAKMFEDNTSKIENDQIKDVITSMVDYINQMHEELEEFSKDNESFDMSEAEEFFFPEYNERLDNPDMFKGITCGLEEIDRKTLGFYPSQLIVILAPTGGGKSIQKLNWALHANQVCKKKVLYFSFEMNSWLCKLRHICLLAEINYDIVKNLKLSAADIKHIEEKFLELKSGPYFQYEISFEDPTPEFVEQKIREIASKKGMPDLVFVDYIGNMTTRGSNKHAKQWEQNGDAAVGLFRLAKRYNIPVVTSQQINRETFKENRKNKENGKAVAYYQDAASGDQRLMHLATYVIGVEPDREANLCWYHPVKMRDAPFLSFAARVIPEFNKIMELTSDQKEVLKNTKTADLETSNKDYSKFVPTAEQTEVVLTDWGLDDI